MTRWMLAFALIVIACPASAEPQCTKEEKQKWLTESDMKAKIAELGYTVKVFKVTRGNCYEIYGFDKSGKRIEIYFHPVSGQAIEEHRS